MTIIPIKDDAHWREVRQRNVGGSDIAALFSCSPYLTRFELWHYKKGTLTDVSEDTVRTFWGKTLEAGIATGLANQNGWKIERPAGYYQHKSVKGMGCTPDYFIVLHPDYRGRGVFQIKNVDYLEYVHNWVDDEPPINYQLQLQHEIGCTDSKWGALGVLIAGNEGKVFIYARHAATIKCIESAIKLFWESIEHNKEPSAVSGDYETVRRIYRKNNGTQVDLTSDNEMPHLCAGTIDARERRLAAQKEEEGYKAEIIRKMAGAERALCGGFTVNYPEHSYQMEAKEKYDRNYRKLIIKENIA